MNQIRRRIAGLTFLEIMLAIVILSLLGSVGVNNWYDYRQKLALDAVSAQLISFLNRVQSLANWQNGSYQLRTIETDSQAELIVINEVNQRPIAGLAFSSPEKSVLLKPSELTSPVVFYGQRNMASPGHFVVGNDRYEIRVIVSARGRIRRCVDGSRSLAQPIMGISLC